MQTSLKVVAIVSLAVPAFAQASPRIDSTLIPRRVFFGTGDRSAPRLSPDGKQLAFIAPVADVLNLWVGPLDDLASARPVTADKRGGITNYAWTLGGELLYFQDRDGDENSHVFRVDRSGRAPAKDLTPGKGRTTRLRFDRDTPNEAIVFSNDRSPEHEDIYRIDLTTGKRRRVFKNDRYDAFVFHRLEPRFARRTLPNGSIVYVDLRAPKAKPLMSIPVEDEEGSGVAGINRAGTTLYYTDSRGRDTAALFKLDLATRQKTLLVEDAEADVDLGMLDLETEEPLTATSTYDRDRRHIVDDRVRADFAYLATVAAGDVSVINRSQDNARWLVQFDSPEAPGRVYRYDRTPTKQATLLFHTNEQLAKLKLSPMHARVLQPGRSKNRSRIQSASRSWAVVTVATRR